MKTGCIFQIQRFCIHDGDGIRTTVFLKGCPLRCRWCSNPESQLPEPEILFRRENCISCGACVQACAYGAITLQDGKIQRNVSRCKHCGTCSQICIYHAATTAGQTYTVEQVVQICSRDIPFYQRSGGGVTLSGGEPFAQPEFTLKLLQQLKENGISTAVETTGFAATQILLSADADQFLFDFKCLDQVRHQRLTGVSNELILKNLKALSACRNVIVRMPLIPGCNMDTDTIQQTGAYLSQLSIQHVHLLAYHTLGEGKYDCLGRTYPMGNLSPPDSEEIHQIQRLLRSYVPHVLIME